MKDLKLWLIQSLSTIAVLVLHQVICNLTEKLQGKLHLSRKATQEKLNFSTRKIFFFGNKNLQFKIMV